MIPPRKCLLLMLVSIFQVNSIGSCPEACPCEINMNSCGCSHDVTFGDNSKILIVSVCCGDEKQLSLMLQSQVNKTFSEVSVKYNHPCSQNSVEFSLPLVNILKLSINKTNFTNFVISVQVRTLQEINLSFNKLKYITKGLFQKFLNLRTLDLSRNQLSNISERGFHGLNKLEFLNLSENNLTNLANVFTTLKNLQHLNLSRNKIEFIEEDYFDNLLLQQLDVSYNNLRRLSPDALQALPNLGRLLLAHNPQLGSMYAETQLLLGTGRRLQQVDVSRTGLLQVPEAFTPSVRFLSLGGNRITSIRCGDLDSYPLLQSLDFPDNKIALVEDDSLGRLDMLLFLNINKNLLTNVPKSMPVELKYLSINENLIKNVSMGDFKNLYNLRILMLKSNEINYIEDCSFVDLRSLQMLDLSNNPLKMLSSNSFEGPLALQDLRLCFLNVSQPAGDGTFPLWSLESLQMVHLQASPGLARQMLADSAALAALSHLQYLDLRWNNLTEIRKDLLFYLSQLKTLRLHGNNINCSAELWLKDWLSWNKSLSYNESCFYSTSPEITNYNCIFPETFTISDSLPPVNLYSTEMINKLLRYYGYNGNKTEKVSSRKININEIELRENAINLKRKNGSILSGRSDILSENENLIMQHNFMNNSRAAVKARESSKILHQRKIQNDDPSNMDRRVLDLKPYSFLSSRGSKKVYDGSATEEPRQRSGVKRLNTPLDIASLNARSDAKASVTDGTGRVEDNEVVRVNNVGSGSVRSEFSPYKSVGSSGGSHASTVVSCGLALIALALLASFGWRQRRRRGRQRAPDSSSEQIEVANISGRVLW